MTQKKKEELFEVAYVECATAKWDWKQKSYLDALRHYAQYQKLVVSFVAQGVMKKYKEWVETSEELFVKAHDAAWNSFMVPGLPSESNWKTYWNLHRRLPHKAYCAWIQGLRTVYMPR